jgi:hypothetical protein
MMLYNKIYHAYFVNVTLGNFYTVDGQIIPCQYFMSRAALDGFWSPWII